MARGDAALHESGAAGQAQRGLGDVVAGVGAHALAEGVNLGGRGGRAHQHAVAAGAMHLLDHQLGHMGQHMVQIGGLAALPGGHVVQDGLLAQVEADHVRHIGVDGLVVRHPGADGIGQDQMALFVDREQARHAQHGVGAEGQGVEEGVVDAAVDHVHPLRPHRGAHVEVVVLDEEVLPLHQLHAHLLGQEGVLEIGAVEGSRREHHHGGVVHGAGVAQGVEQQGGVVGHRRHLVALEKLGEEPHHHLAVLQHVGDPAGHAQIVFQHVVAAVRVADQVHPGDVGVDAQRQVQALHGGLVLGIGKDLLGRDQAGLDDLVIVVDVPEELVQRADALAQAGLQQAPFLGRHDARHGVEGDQALGAGLVAVDGKGDAHLVEEQIGLGPLLGQGLGRLGLQPVGKGLVVRAYRPAGQQHLVMVSRGREGQGMHRSHSNSVSDGADASPVPSL